MFTAIKIICGRHVKITQNFIHFENYCKIARVHKKLNIIFSQQASQTITLVKGHPVANYE